MPITVLGAGSFGTCLAILCAHDHDVRIWARDSALAEALNRERRNPNYLSEVRIPENVRATADLEEALTGSELVICAVPSHGVRDVMSRAAPVLPDGALVVSTVKGLELGSWMRMEQVLQDVLAPAHHARFVFLSGPSFAKEVAAGQPTAVTLACRQESFAISVQASISRPWFRCYSATDVVGVEIGGALKNVVAIAVGICDGLGLGHNARAGVMTRGLREITRLGAALGADPMTFLGLAGMGDLVLTCTSDLSRNRRVGLALGGGQKLDEIVGAMSEVAEGVRTTTAACVLARRHKIEMPIAEAVQRVLEGEIGVEGAVNQLMSRQLRNENE
ncbi:MAG: NAD(P)-dependent glycerol-3-phosphate dehydrogenase [Deltaproteobacteria bacterium]|nr:NAD(P)-dependent glycerol-3-phosphate dehydrogenase [Deltaproteobacteria bacterium]MBW2360695.1 NAD(P)-dependent glycerol-3-phosphate dehydrogenase [Deltaproteobacteria bacterium]